MNQENTGHASQEPSFLRRSHIPQNSRLVLKPFPCRLWCNGTGTHQTRLPCPHVSVWRPASYGVRHHIFHDGTGRFRQNTGYTSHNNTRIRDKRIGDGDNRKEPVPKNIISIGISVAVPTTLLWPKHHLIPPIPALPDILPRHSRPQAKDLAYRTDNPA